VRKNAGAMTEPMKRKEARSLEGAEEGGHSRGDDSRDLGKKKRKANAAVLKDVKGRRDEHGGQPEMAAPRREISRPEKIRLHTEGTEGRAQSPQRIALLKEGAGMKERMKTRRERKAAARRRESSPWACRWKRAEKTDAMSIAAQDCTAGPEAEAEKNQEQWKKTEQTRWARWLDGEEDVATVDCAAGISVKRSGEQAYQGGRRRMKGGGLRR